MGDTPQERARAAAQTLCDAVNDFGFDAPAFVALIVAQHRTLQQGVGRAVVGLLEEWAAREEAGYYDGRNEAISKFARKVVDATDERDRAMPLI